MNETIKATKSGEKVMKELLRRYSNVQIPPVVDKPRDPSAVRKKTNLVKWMMRTSSVTEDEAAQYLGWNTYSFRTRCSRDSFTFEELLCIAHACNFSLIFAHNKESVDCRIDPLCFFEGYNNGIAERLKEADLLTAKERKKIYEEAKAKLEQLKHTYGIEEI